MQYQTFTIVPDCHVSMVEPRNPQQWAIRVESWIVRRDEPIPETIDGVDLSPSEARQLAERLNELANQAELISRPHPYGVNVEG